ncbi:SphA family protein [Bradyrhizobium sp. RDT10]
MFAGKGQPDCLILRYVLLFCNNLRKFLQRRSESQNRLNARLASTKPGRCMATGARMMIGYSHRRSWSRQAVVGAAALGAITMASPDAKADAGGVSFWLPGLMGSLAAVPGQPGWGLATFYIHLNSSAGGGKELQRNASIVAGLQAHADVVAIAPSYTFATPVLGGVASVALIGVPGNVGVGIDATLTGPRGNQISGSVSDNRTTWADVFYQGSLKWNQGVHNYMTYVTGNIPSGTYDPNRLANLSYGFVAVDAGAGYTYLNPQTGHEFSAVAGLTYNFINPHTQYQNGVDFHLDWAASKFVTKSIQVGLAGYFFQQLTGDSGIGAKLGDFKGSAVGIGPQIGFFFPAGEGYQGYLNLRGYWDLATENRPTSSTVFVTLAFSPAAPEHPTPRRPMRVKAP